MNREIPARAPLRRMGEIPVLARVAWEDGAQQWCAATAVRWTSTHVMVTWRDELRTPRTEHFEWLRAQDVVRSVTWPNNHPEFVAKQWSVGQLRAELVGLPDDLQVLVLVADDGADDGVDTQHLGTPPVPRHPLPLPGVREVRSDDRRADAAFGLYEGTNAD